MVKIVDGITAKNEESSIFSLAFGINVNFEFLSTLSWKNGGVAIYIWPELDIGKQMSDFVNSIWKPTLRRLRFSYGSLLQASLDLSKSVYYDGSDIILSGIVDTNETITTLVTGKLNNNTVLTQKETHTQQSITNENVPSRRIYLLLKILELAKQIKVYNALDPIYAKVLEMALENQFVIPGVTAMVVTELDIIAEDSNGFSLNYISIVTILIVTIFITM